MIRGYSIETARFKLWRGHALAKQPLVLWATGSRQSSHFLHHLRRGSKGCCAHSAIGKLDSPTGRGRFELSDMVGDEGAGGL